VPPEPQTLNSLKAMFESIAEFGAFASKAMLDETASTAASVNDASISREWRIWLADTPPARDALYDVEEKMIALIGHKGFAIKQPFLEQHFCAGPTCSSKANMRNGELVMETRQLQSVCSKGTEAWEQVSHVTDHTKLPWVSLLKTVSRCDGIGKITGVEGLEALEIAEIAIVNTCVHPSFPGEREHLEHNNYLTVVVEGTSASIEHMIHKLKLTALTPFAIRNLEAHTELHNHNVSFPRFIASASGFAASTGHYVIKSMVAVGMDVSLTSRDVMVLHPGQHVEVIDVIPLPKERRLRARIRSPEGYITLTSQSQEKKPFHWAEPVAGPRRAIDPKQPTSVWSAFTEFFAGDHHHMDTDDMLK